jgi:hypothetical protein
LIETILPHHFSVKTKLVATNKPIEPTRLHPSSKQSSHLAFSKADQKLLKEPSLASLVSPSKHPYELVLTLFSHL